LTTNSLSPLGERLVVQSRKKRNKSAMPESASVAAIALKGIEKYYRPFAADCVPSSSPSGPPHGQR